MHLFAINFKLAWYCLPFKLNQSADLHVCMTLLWHAVILTMSVVIETLYFWGAHASTLFSV